MSIKDVQGLKDQVLTGLAGIVAAAAVWIAVSVTTLNTQIAVVIQQISNHEKRIETLERK